MKGEAKSAECKKKAIAKSPAKVVKKKQPASEVVSIVGKPIPNKHHTYIKIVENDKGGFQMGSANSKDLSYLGTYDLDLIDHIFNQIVSICFAGKSASEAKILSTNGALAALLEIDPQDSTELMLATQMVTAHNVAMEMARRALLVENQTDEGVNFNVNRMTKLMRTYTAQMEALNKYRSKGQQKITVQHVNVNEGGQAIVGDVTQGGGNK